MSKLKATQSGKAGKHKGQDSFNTAFVRGVRTARVTTSLDRFLLDRIRRGSSEEPDGALAGSRHTNLSVRA
jgi:hypothetical protein